MTKDEWEAKVAEVRRSSWRVRLLFWINLRLEAMVYAVYVRRARAARRVQREQEKRRNWRS